MDRIFSFIFILEMDWFIFLIFVILSSASWGKISLWRKQNFIKKCLRFFVELSLCQQTGNIRLPNLNSPSDIKINVWTDDRLFLSAVICKLYNYWSWPNRNPTTWLSLAELVVGIKAFRNDNEISEYWWIGGHENIS